jgi:hypothetical protein
MLAILRSLASLLAKKSRASVSSPKRFGTARPLRAGNVSHPVLAEVSASLERATALLLTPNPQSIRTVTFIVRDASIRLNRLKGVEMGPEFGDELQRVQAQLRRTRSLVEGAMKVQWTNIRRLMALTQSYAPPGRISRFAHRCSRIDVRV